MAEEEAHFSLRAVLGLLIFTLLNPLALFLTAGTRHWPEGWGYTVILILSLFGSRLITYFKFPGLLMERGILRFLYGRPLESLLITWGIGMILQQGARLFFGDQTP